MTRSAKKISNLSLRLATTLVIAPLALALIWFGGWPYIGFIVAGGVLVLFEWRGITQTGWPGFAIGAVAIGWAAILAGLGLFGWSFAVIAGMTFLAGMLALIGGAQGWFWEPLGVLYTAIPVVSLVILRIDPAGLYAVAFVMLAIWVTDSAAFGAGRAIGGAKLWPAVSPNKTWAGLLGGMTGAALAGMVLAFLIPGAAAVYLAVLAAGLAFVSQGGDLAESALKRHFGVKDSGFLFPGHGGILDRVDGLIAAAVAAAMYGTYRASFDRAAQGLMFW